MFYTLVKFINFNKSVNDVKFRTFAVEMLLLFEYINVVLWKQSLASLTDHFIKLCRFGSITKNCISLSTFQNSVSLIETSVTFKFRTSHYFLNKIYNLTVQTVLTIGCFPSLIYSFLLSGRVFLFFFLEGIRMQHYFKQRGPFPHCSLLEVRRF